MSNNHGTVDRRDAKGRFSSGNPGGPGRPRRETERAYLAATFANVTPEQWGQIVALAVAQALQGDAKARQFLAEHLLPERPKMPPLAIVCELLGTTPEELAVLMREARKLLPEAT